MSKIGEQYQLAKMSVQMKEAQLVEFQIERVSEESAQNIQTNFQFFHRLESVQEKRKGTMLVELETYNRDTHHALVSAKVVYEGVFERCDPAITDDELTEFSKIQTVPQLLPYCRSILTMVSAHLGGKPIELPTMDVIESIIQNKKDEKVCDDE